MSLLDRLFRSKKPDAPDADRIDHAAHEGESTPRQVRAMVYREATVVYDSGYKRKGVVLDHTATGVRLRFPTNERLPEFVTLHARAVHLEGPAKVVWQSGSEVGLTLSQ